MDKSYHGKRAEKQRPLAQFASERRSEEPRSYRNSEEPPEVPKSNPSQLLSESDDAFSRIPGGKVEPKIRIGDSESNNIDENLDTHAEEDHNESSSLSGNSASYSKDNESSVSDKSEFVSSEDNDDESDDETSESDEEEEVEVEEEEEEDKEEEDEKEEARESYEYTADKNKNPPIPHVGILSPLVEANLRSKGAKKSSSTMFVDQNTPRIPNSPPGGSLRHTFLPALAPPTDEMNQPFQYIDPKKHIVRQADYRQHSNIPFSSPDSSLFTQSGGRKRSIRDNAAISKSTTRKRSRVDKMRTHNPSPGTSEFSLTLPPNTSTHKGGGNRDRTNKGTATSPLSEAVPFLQSSSTPTPLNQPPYATQTNVPYIYGRGIGHNAVPRDPREAKNKGNYSGTPEMHLGRMEGPYSGGWGWSSQGSEYPNDSATSKAYHNEDQEFIPYQGIHTGSIDTGEMPIRTPTKSTHMVPTQPYHTALPEWTNFYRAEEAYYGHPRSEGGGVLSPQLPTNRPVQSPRSFEELMSAEQDAMSEVSDNQETSQSHSTPYFRKLFDPELSTWSPPYFRGPQIIRLDSGDEDNAARIELIGDIMGMVRDWDVYEIKASRRLVYFRREQFGSVIRVYFNPISEQEYTEGMCVVSCIWNRNTHEYCFTSVDCIHLLEGVINKQFPVEEKNRVRRNLEACKPTTVSKNKRGYELFFKQIMSYDSPKPRTIEKDVKVFAWKMLDTALKKIVAKYEIMETSAPEESESSGGETIQLTYNEDIGPVHSGNTHGGRSSRKQTSKRAGRSRNKIK